MPACVFCDIVWAEGINFFLADGQVAGQEVFDAHAMAVTKALETA